MNKLSHIRWFEWVVFIILILCIIPFCIAEFFHSYFSSLTESTLLPHHLSAYTLLTYFSWALCSLLYVSGLVLYFLRKRLGWMLLFSATVYLTDIYFRWFFCSDSPDMLRVYFSLHFFLYLYCLTVFLLPYVRRQFNISMGHIFLCILFVLPFIIVEVNKTRLSFFLATWMY